MRQKVELAVLGKLWHLQHHADLQAARHLQGQSRAAELGEVLSEGPQQLTALCIVET